MAEITRDSIAHCHYAHISQFTKAALLWMLRHRLRWLAGRIVIHQLRARKIEYIWWIMSEPDDEEAR